MIDGQPLRAPASIAAEPSNPPPAGWWDQRPPWIGDEAPPLSFEFICDRPEGVPDPAVFTWSDFAGRVVVVDLSTSWCGPCRAMIPHFNALADALAGEPIVFFTFTNEPAEAVDRFRADFEFRSLLARDVDGSTFEDYWVNGIPHVAIIDGRGRIAALTHPGAISAEGLRTLARGGSFDLPLTNDSPVRMSWNTAARRAVHAAPPGLESSLAFAILTPADALSGMVRSDPTTGELIVEGATARTLLSFALDLPPRFIELRDEPQPSAVYRAAIRPGDGRSKTARRMLLAMLESVLGVRASITNDPGEVRVLHVADRSKLPPRAESGGRAGSMSPGNFDMQSLTLAVLARHLSGFSSLPIQDETCIDDAFQIRLSYDPTARGGLVEALGRIGLELAPAERPIRRAVIERAPVR